MVSKLTYCLLHFITVLLVRDLMVVQFILQDQIQLLKSLISKTVTLMNVEELFMHTVTMQKLKIPHSIQVLPNTVAPFI